MDEEDLAVAPHRDVEQRSRELVPADAAQRRQLLGERGAKGGESVSRHAGHGGERRSPPALMTMLVAGWGQPGRLVLAALFRAATAPAAPATRRALRTRAAEPHYTS
jgi:hypothetical protein